MKIAINILKGLEIVLTAIWGIFLGVLAPLAIMYGDMVDESIANHFIVRVWLVNSVLCYFVGTIIVMLGLYKIALGFHTVGLITSLVIYGVFEDIFNNPEFQNSSIKASNPAFLYMPVMFITLATLAITIIANYKKITAKLLESNNKKYEAAPSVLGGEYKTDKPEHKKGTKSTGKSGNTGKSKKGSKK